MPDVKSIAISAETEFLVLACDGIWDCVSSPEVVNFIEQRLPLGDPKMLKSFNNSGLPM